MPKTYFFTVKLVVALFSLFVPVEFFLKINKNEIEMLFTLLNI